MAGKSLSLVQIEETIVNCDRCVELREYLVEVGRVKRKAYAEEEYWARPVPGFGDREGARIWMVGLAPGAHGANRTGRMFTGDRSGDFLYAALHRCGMATQANADGRDDGLELRGVYISAALRCAPPKNKPTAGQLAVCRSYLVDEWLSLAASGRPVRGIVALGAIAWQSVLRMGGDLDWDLPRGAEARFGHGFEVEVGPTRLLGSYHVSQQNTFTGRLTVGMFDEILGRAGDW